MPYTKDNIWSSAVGSTILAVVALILVFCMGPSPPRPDSLSARVLKLETQMLELSALATRCQALDSITTCDYAALLRRTIALEDRAEQLEPSLPPNDIKDS